MAPFDTIHGPHFAPVDSHYTFHIIPLSNGDPLADADGHAGAGKITPTVNFNVFMGTVSLFSETEWTPWSNLDNAAAADEVHADPGVDSRALSMEKHDNSSAA